MAMFYLIRHAMNDFIGRAIAGRQPNVHLNAKGELQARQLAEVLASAGVEKVISSPLERCLETAAPLAQRIGVQVEVSAAFNELDFGGWTNRLTADLEEQPGWRLWNSFRSGTRLPQGELMIDVQSRVVGEIQRLTSAFPHMKIAIVTHGDPIRALLLYFLGTPLDFIHRIEISPASVSLLALTERSAQILFMNRCGS